MSLCPPRDRRPPDSLTAAVAGGFCEIEGHPVCAIRKTISQQFFRLVNRLGRGVLLLDEARVVCVIPNHFHYVSVMVLKEAHPYNNGPTPFTIIQEPERILMLEKQFLPFYYPNRPVLLDDVSQTASALERTNPVGIEPVANLHNVTGNVVPNCIVSIGLQVSCSWLVVRCTSREMTAIACGNLLSGVA